MPSPTLLFGWFTGLLALCLVGCSTSQPIQVASPSWQQQLDQAAREALETSGTPSLQIAVGSGGKVIYQGAWGFADLEHQVPASNLTRYRTASISKLFTAVAAMRLAEAGNLDLDVTIQTYCPAFPIKRWTITPRQLLTHTAGIRHYIDYDSTLAAATTEEERHAIQDKQNGERLSSVTRYSQITPTLESFKNDPLLFEPGSSWAYSSFGYRVLACVIEGAAKQPFRSVLQTQVFDIAGMAGATDDDAWAIIPNRAAGYRLGRDKSIRRADLRDVSENLPAGGHLASATDLVLLAETLRTNVLVSPVTTRWMYLQAKGSAKTAEPSWRDAIPSESKYGAGMMLFPAANGLRVGHTGRQAGGSAIVAWLPNADLSIAIMTNAKGWNGYISLLGTIQKLLEQADPKWGLAGI